MKKRQFTSTTSSKNHHHLSPSDRARYRYLLECNDLFRHFIPQEILHQIDSGENNNNGDDDESITTEAKQGSKKKSSSSSKQSHQIHRSSEVKDLEDSSFSSPACYFSSSPPFIANGQLRDYQVEGLNWLISLYHRNINGILADEMGLGKTLQTIALLGYLRECQGITGPHLLLVPKSTLQNWLMEFGKWLPHARPFILHGDAAARKQAIDQRIKTRDFDICITSYEICLKEKSSLGKVHWEYMVIDEAHRIKNENSILSQVVRLLPSKHRLLLTGTPLQNNLHELWALLNFLLPDVFGSGQVFDDWFQQSIGEGVEEKEDGNENENENENEDVNQKNENENDNENENHNLPFENVAGENVVEEIEKSDADSQMNSSPPPNNPDSPISQSSTNNSDSLNAQSSSSQQQEQMVLKFRGLLQPFMLRRLKVEVEATLLPKKELYLYVGMSGLQRHWYQTILQRDIPTINAAALAPGSRSSKTEYKTRLANVAMQLRKCCNHPYLFDGAEPGPPFTNDHHLVTSCGKMLLLDKLLAKLKANGSRVLLFSQMSRMLDILEDYCDYRGYAYCRIDGQTSHDERVEAIDDYNAKGSDKFIFLLTTRAGGLGINLTSADIVILYDSDWNPQVDLQAQDRAHRIGQTKQVYVFRFVTEASFEEKVMERALQKLRLDQLVIQQGKAPNASKALSASELLEMVHHGAREILAAKSSTSSDDQELEASIDIEQILKRGEVKTQELLSKYSNAGLEDLVRMEEAINSTPLTGGGGAGGIGDFVPLELAKRDRKPPTYSVDEYYREALSGGGGGKRSKGNPEAIPKPKLPQLHDFHFVGNSSRLSELFTKETLHFQKTHGFIPEDPEEAARVQSAEPLSEQEIVEKEQLLASGFTNWTRREYQAFLRASERHGRGNIPAIAEEIEGKTRGEVEAYARTFWQRYKELPDWEKVIWAITKGEERLERAARLNKILKRKVAMECAAVRGAGWKGIRIPENCPSCSNSGWTEESTKFLLFCSAKHGSDCGDLGERIWEDLRREPVFDLDFFLRTRSVLDLGRRIGAVLQAVENEVLSKAAAGCSAGAENSAGQSVEGQANTAGSRKQQTNDAIKAAQKSVASLFKIGSILNKDL